MKNIFIDIEFNRDKKQITEIGAIYDKKVFFEKVDNLKITLKNFYNYIPNEYVNFVFFGSEDSKIISQLTEKESFSDEINGMILALTSGINIRNFLKPINISLVEFLDNLGGNVAYPIHNALNDAINLQTLFFILQEKKVVSKLVKIAKYENKNLSDNISNNIHDNIKELFGLTGNGSYKKGQKSIMGQMILVDKSSGEEFILNKLDKENIKNNIYSIKLPEIIKNFKGIKKECSIFLIENIDAKTLSIEKPAEKMALYTGQSIKFCENFIKELFEKGFLLRLSSNCYQISENIVFLDSESSRRILIKDEKSTRIKIIS